MAKAIQEQLSRISRYADADLAQSFAEQIAAYERVTVEQIVLGEILESLGFFSGSEEAQEESLFIPLPDIWHSSMLLLRSEARSSRSPRQTIQKRLSN